eukprot:gb/GEZN01003934.1/.p1 GENE.gb/GEZN01003934.1/~~gb/GEZN01003934.1/.p1  ORF type:complete len:353 (+),score=30.63 gb/GEZN01003934.1/:31-1089(+)
MASSGSSCHFCHNGFTEAGGSLWYCTFTKPHSRGRQCRKKFCQACLARKFPAWLNAESRAAGEWKCPSCSDSCDCATCRTCEHGALRKRCTHEGCDHHPHFVTNYRSSRGPKSGQRREAQALPYNRPRPRSRSRLTPVCTCGQADCNSVCPSCNAASPGTAKFCGECGFRLPARTEHKVVVKQDAHCTATVHDGHGGGVTPKTPPSSSGGAFTFPSQADWVGCPQDICTFLSTGRDFVMQPVFTCTQCNMEAKREVCCQACALQCHAGHVGVRFLQEGKAYCDCGASNPNCKAEREEQQHNIVALKAEPSSTFKPRPHPAAAAVANDIQEAAAAMVGLAFGLSPAKAEIDTP